MFGEEKRMHCGICRATYPQGALHVCSGEHHDVRKLDGFCYTHNRYCYKDKEEMGTRYGPPPAPLSPRIAEHQDWMETDSRFAQPCPDLDQELPEELAPDGMEPMDPELKQEPWEANHKLAPLARGLLDFFPKALASVANCSWTCNEQHNPGEPMYWAREKSADEADALVRHLVDRGKLDSDGVRHSAKVAWRALAMLERELDGEKI